MLAPLDESHSWPKPGRKIRARLEHIDPPLGYTPDLYRECTFRFGCAMVDFYFLWSLQVSRVEDTVDYTPFLSLSLLDLKWE